MHLGAAVRLMYGYLPINQGLRLATIDRLIHFPTRTTEIRNWAAVAAAMEAKGATNSQMYIRAKALAQGKLDPMPTSSPEAPYSISAV